MAQRQPKKLLTIGGSDSGGSAGIQADLKSWTALGAHGMCALTVLTAQNTRTIAGLQFVEPDFLALQIETVLADYGADAIKTGFIGRKSLITTIADCIRGRPNVIIDPVLLNSQGQPLFDKTVVDSYRDDLFPLAALVTPNINEASLLTGQPIDTLEELEAAARSIYALGCQAVLIKRFRQADSVIDLLFDGERSSLMSYPWIETQNTHGSGDSLSAAIAYHIANGASWETAIEQARQFVAAGLSGSQSWQLGAGQGPIAHYTVK